MITAGLKRLVTITLMVSLVFIKIVLVQNGKENFFFFFFSFFENVIKYNNRELPVNMS